MNGHIGFHGTIVGWEARAVPVGIGIVSQVRRVRWIGGFGEMAGDGDDAGVDGEGGEVVDDVSGEPEAFAAVSAQQGFVDGGAHDEGGAEEEWGGDEGEEEEGGLFVW